MGRRHSGTFSGTQPQAHRDLRRPGHTRSVDNGGAEHPLYFTDAAHPAYTAHPGYGWIRKGETRELKSNHGRVRVNINGALSWPERQVVHHTAEKITSAAMIALFADLQARHPTASAIWVVLDNARYNHSRALRTWLAGEGCRIRSATADQ